MRNRLCLSIWISLFAPLSAWGQIWAGHIEVNLTRASRQFCHIIRFPRGWAIQRIDNEGQRLFFDYSSKYEFRVQGLLGTKFLVGGFAESIGTRYDTINRYTVDLSDGTAPVRQADREIWEAAAVVPLTRKSTFPPIGTVPNETRAEFNGFQFVKSGDTWAQPSDGATRLSPDQAWLVLQSYSGKGDHGPAKVFFEVFNAETGKKALTIEGTYSTFSYSYDPDGILSKTAWLTERYFIVPLGKHKERCLVCEFGGRER